MIDASERCSRTARTSRARSRVEAYRSSGSFCRQRSTIQRNGAGTPALSCPTGSVSSRMIAVSVSAVVPRWKARLPVAIS